MNGIEWIIHHLYFELGPVCHNQINKVEWNLFCFVWLKRNQLDSIEKL